MKKSAALFLICWILITVSSVICPVSGHTAAADFSAGIVVTDGSRLNVRSGAGTASSVITSLDKGSYITLIGRSGAWWKVEYAQGQYGYCHADYIQTVSAAAAAVQTQSGRLNVRNGAGTAYAVVASLEKGETVLILSSANGWSRILYHGVRLGYVSSRYLSQVQTAVYSRITLPVPSYKQTDSRWAGVLIGNSGKTMAQIGCATTGIAMMESYRTGATVTPDVMSKKLTYTVSGSVYWPGYYTAVTNSVGYLSVIYNQLKQGTPVLLGAAKSTGGQHFVVVTGFAGGNSLTASGFTVNDPGSSSRTTLQQFLNDYPVFYKFFYY